MSYECGAVRKRAALFAAGLTLAILVKELFL